MLANFLERFGAIHIGHLEVEEDEIWFELLNKCNAPLAVIGKLHLKAVCFKFHPVHLVDYGIVFDDSYFCHNCFSLYSYSTTSFFVICYAYDMCIFAYCQN